MRRKLPFDVIMADPPWPFGDRLPGATRGASRQYATMSLAEIELYTSYDNLWNQIADDAILFLWRVAAIPEWIDVCRVWGFTPKAELVWVKVGKTQTTMCTDVREPNAVLVYGGYAKLAFGMGHKVRNCHEVCVIAQRGKGLEVADKSIRSVFFAPLREHSRKPDEAYRIAERMYPHANRLELFARERRAGWTCHGNEIGIFDEVTL